MIKNGMKFLSKDLKKYIYKPIYVGHYFCHVFHREYALHKNANPAEVKKNIVRQVKKSWSKNILQNIMLDTCTKLKKT